MRDTSSSFCTSCRFFFLVKWSGRPARVFQDTRHLIFCTQHGETTLSKRTNLDLGGHRDDCHKRRRAARDVGWSNLKVRLRRYSDACNLTSRGEVRGEHAERGEYREAKPRASQLAELTVSFYRACPTRRSRVRGHHTYVRSVNGGCMLRGEKPGDAPPASRKYMPSEVFVRLVPKSGVASIPRVSSEGKIAVEGHAQK